MMRNHYMFNYSFDIIIFVLYHEIVDCCYKLANICLLIAGLTKRRVSTRLRCMSSQTSWRRPPSRPPTITRMSRPWTLSSRKWTSGSKNSTAPSSTCSPTSSASQWSVTGKVLQQAAYHSGQLPAKYSNKQRITVVSWRQSSLTSIASQWSVAGEVVQQAAHHSGQLPAK